MYMHTPGYRQLTRGLRIALIIGFVGTTLASPLNGHAAQTLTLSAGAESRGGDVQLNAFAPNEITINVGDTLTWRLDSTEFHNILFTNGEPAPEFVEAGPDGVFLNPAVALPTGGSTFDGTGPAGSGLLNKGDTYSLTFTKQGVFTYLCAIHAGMGGVVKAVAAGQSADIQAAVDARRTAQINADLAERAIPAIMSNIGELVTSGDTLGVAAGVENGPVDVQRFLPQLVTVHTGDAVAWIWKTVDVPHTVTFLGREEAPEVIVPHPQPDGPPRLELSPRVLAPSGDPTNWDGTGYLNSGFLAPRSGEPAPTFTVHFTSPGTFDYVCLLHEGMRGTIVVRQTANETAANLEEPGEEE
jgi:plastocyanin